MSNKLATADDALMEIPLGDHFKITTDGLQITGTPTFQQCSVLWNFLRTFERTIQFAIGDAAKYIRERFGERADQIITAATGWTPETVRTYEWTAEQVPKHVRRMDVLDYSHHQVVARLTPREQKQWLDKAADGEEGQRWPVAKLKSAVRASIDPNPVKAWVLVVMCTSEKQRDKLREEMEGRGLQCRSGEQRGGKEQ